MLDNSTITMKQYVRFQEGIGPDNIKPDQIQNVRLSAIIDTNMHILQTEAVN